MLYKVMWWQKKLQVISRHCFFSSISQHKKRFLNFSHEKCHLNLRNTIDLKKAEITYILDAAKGKNHFISKYNPIEIQAGTEACAFLKLLDYLESLSLHPKTPIYIVEDDYLHREGWVDVLLEGLSLEDADYITLYDHNDKYFFREYDSLKSKLYHTKSCHWRTTPSTTQTFATRYKTLLEDLSIHRKFSSTGQISQDHQKFIALSKQGRTLISSIPGYSTHVEKEYASPCFDWNQYLEETLCTHQP